MRTQGKQKRIKYARVLVEINADVELPNTVKTVDKKGNVYTQSGV